MLDDNRTKSEQPNSADLNEKLQKKGAAEMEAALKDPWYLHSWWNLKFAQASGFAGLALGFLVIYVIIRGQEDVLDDAGDNAITFVLVSVIGTVLIYTFGLIQMRRSYSMSSWCRSNGWEYRDRGDPFRGGIVKHPEDLKDSKLYWSEKQSQNSMAKKFNDRGVIVLERYYWPGVGNARYKKVATFLVMDYGGTAPEMILHPRHMTDKLALPGDLKEVTFESNAFNSKWTVKTMDPKAAYDRLDQSTLEYLQNIDLPLAIEFTGNLLVIKHHAASIEARKVLLKFVQGLTEAVPDDLMPKLTMPSLAKGD